MKNKPIKDQYNKKDGSVVDNSNNKQNQDSPSHKDTNREHQISFVSIPRTNITIESKVVWITLSLIPSLIVGAVALYISFESFVRRIATNEQTVAELSRLLRPICIFDQDGSILHDSGASTHFSNIKIEESKLLPGEIGFGLPKTITITFNHHIQTAPHLSLLDPYYVGVTSRRGQMFEWIYEIVYEGQSGTVKEGKCRFKLEIL